MKQIAVIYLVHIFYTPSNSLQHLAHDQVGGSRGIKEKQNFLINFSYLRLFFAWEHCFVEVEFCQLFI